jgi:hypothetical protein
MQNKGSALIFLFVLFIMCVGTYAAVSTLVKGRGGNVIALETLTPTTGAGVTVTSSIPVPTDTPAQTPTPHSELSTPVAPTATPIPPATPTSPPRPTATPTHTPTLSASGPTPAPPAGEYLFRVSRNERDCSASGGYIRGTVYDADGTGLQGINIFIRDDYGNTAGPVQSKGPPNAGEYDFPRGSDPGLFHLLIVDNIGRALSAVVDVDYLPNCTNYIDWQRVR